ncbi:MAG: hypothetical protein AAGA20_10625 [Planctomycetota bacterium]
MTPTLAVAALLALAEAQPTVPVHVTVLMPDGAPVRFRAHRRGEPLDPAAQHAVEVRAMNLDDEFPLVPLELHQVEDGRLELPNGAAPGTRLGIAAWEPTLGYAETIVTIPENPSSTPPRVEVELRFPHAGPISDVLVDPKVVEPCPSPRFHYVEVHAPRTGIRLVRTKLSKALQARLSLPEGDYRLLVQGWFPRSSGSHAPLPDAFVTTRDVLEVRGSAPRTIRPKLVQGSKLDLRIETTGNPAVSATSSKASARVTLRPAGAEREINPGWGWYGLHFAIPLPTLPISTNAYSIARLPEGNYTLTVSGPGLVTTDFPVTLPHDGRLILNVPANP